MMGIKLQPVNSGKSIVICCVNASQAAWVANPHILSIIFPMAYKLYPQMRDIYVSSSPALYNLDSLDVEFIAFIQNKGIL